MTARRRRCGSERQKRLPWTCALSARFFPKKMPRGSRSSYPKSAAASKEDGIRRQNLHESGLDAVLRYYGVRTVPLDAKQLVHAVFRSHVFVAHHGNDEVSGHLHRLLDIILTAHACSGRTPATLFTALFAPGEVASCRSPPAVLPSFEPCTEKELPMGFFEPPASLVDESKEMRLIQTLRDAASTRDPYTILARSAAAFFRAQNPTAGAVPSADEELGKALADLAVTGRRSYCLLATPPLTPLHELQLSGAGAHVDLGTAPYTAAQLETKVSDLLATLLTATPAQSFLAVGAALDRAFRSAWAIRGPVLERSATRTSQGWIAVSGEDDMPHRPTNVPGSHYENYEIPVTVPAAGVHKALTVQTRFIVASPLTLNAPRPVHTLRELPPNPAPEVPEGNSVILFLHGHMSGAEEALEIIPYIHRAGLARDTQISVISVDLPNCGYSESFNHEDVANSAATQWPSGPIDREPIRAPVLDFIEDFVIASSTLSMQLHRSRVECVASSAGASAVTSGCVSGGAVQCLRGSAKALCRGTPHRCGRRWSTTTSRARRRGSASSCRRPRWMTRGLTTSITFTTSP